MFSSIDVRNHAVTTNINVSLKKNHHFDINIIIYFTIMDDLKKNEDRKKVKERNNYRIQRHHIDLSRFRH